MISKLLQEIVDNKRKEVEMDKKMFPLESFRNKLKSSKKNYLAALSKNKLSLIAEIKPKSPSKGVIKKELNLKDILKVYNKNADCISVLTDNKYFGGSLELLKAVSESSTLPVLRKDFIVDEYQIYQARLFGADAILLITSLLNEAEIKRFLSIARSLGMACQVEVHDEEDLAKVLKTDAKLIGINNRNLNTMKVDINTTIKLAGKIPEDRLIVSESGINNPADIEKIKEFVDAVHIGSAFMEAEDMEFKIKEIMGVKNENTN